MEKTPRKDSNDNFFPSNVEPTKRMSDEEYEKFIVEAKKGIFALKKIITYTSKVNEWVCDKDCTISFKTCF